MKSTVRDTGDAFGGPGSLVNTGHLHVEGGLHLAGAPPARSAYLDQVEQIFPWELIGRETELAELAAFCTGDHDRTYVWWQGPAWAGKSALMATFVLHPPPGVRVVSFFITARYAGQSDRNAFLEVWPATARSTVQNRSPAPSPSPRPKPRRCAPWPTPWWAAAGWSEPHTWPTRRNGRPAPSPTRRLKLGC